MRDVVAVPIASIRKSALNAAFMAAFVFFAGLLSQPEATAANAKRQPADLWYGIYLLGQPVGGDHENTTVAPFEGRRCLMTDSVTHTSLVLLGQSVQQDVTARDWEDAATGAPIYEEVTMASNGVTTRVTARFSGRRIVAVLDSGGRKETHALTVPAGAELLADDPAMAAPGESVGKKLVYFSPETLSLEPVTISPAAGQPKKNPRKVVVSLSTGTVTITSDADGVPARIDMPAGLIMVRESGEKVAQYMQRQHAVTLAQPSTTGAGAAGEASTPDFAVVASVAPTGAPLLPSPSELVAQVTLSGAPPRSFDIKTVPNPDADQATATVASVRGRADLAPDLANGAYLALDSDEIKTQAAEIAGQRTNLYKIAVHIQEWLHQQMTPTPAVGLPRSSVEILHDRKGVCRDYALLYTALARSAGVPTKLCAGLVGYHGRLYYHAWAESYVGEKIGWIPFDPTLNELPVDASHIPLVKGDPVSIYRLVGNIGDVKVKIIRCAS